jgi:16S rRNA (adenine1518-N6/adenine1519-N6)-dimethyltransferase
LNYEVRGWFKVPATCFFPVPDVDSGCVTLVQRERRLLGRTLTGRFVKTVKRGFSQRRKMLLKLLRPEWPGGDVEAAFERLGLARDVRAEMLSVEQWADLTKALSGHE